MIEDHDKSSKRAQDGFEHRLFVCSFYALHFATF